MPQLKRRVGAKGKDAWFIRAFVENRDIKIHLGTCSEKNANQAFRHVCSLIEANKLGDSPGLEARKWVRSLSSDSTLSKSLLKLGLIDASDASQRIRPELRLLGPFLQDFIDSYEGSERTKKNYTQTKQWLLLRFDEDKPLAEITEEDLHRWCRYLKQEGLKRSNREKHIQRCRTLFLAAVRSRILSESPARSIKVERTHSRPVDSKSFFVSREIFDSVIAGGLPLRYQVAFALMRWQGFRRHETLLLRWPDIDFDKKSINVQSHKTPRVCPLFPEVVPFLVRAKEELHAAGDYVIPWPADDREKADSLTPLLKKAIGKAIGKENIWPDICQTLRRNRRTELEREFPSYLLDRWIGHDYATARDHYLQVLDDDWQRAVTETRN